MPNPGPMLRSLMLLSAAGLSLALQGAPARAATPEAMLQQAQTACLESAGQAGWRTDAAKVISAKAINADKVEVVLDLTKDGTNTARLTCPYSASTGVVGQLGGDGLKDLGPADFGKDFARSMATAGDAGTAVDRSRGWWLLLPVGLGLLSWAALRNGEVASHGGASGGSSRGAGGGGGFRAEAAAGDGLLEVRATPDLQATVKRRVRNGDSVLLSGRCNGEWLETTDGAWVREPELRYDRSAVRFA
jgi:hypothetical protein